MMKENLVYEKAFKFSVRIVNLYKYLASEKKEYILSRQILRSGTSICANIKEGTEGQSKKDFLSKMNIALKEASETEYWLELLKATDYLDESKFTSIIEDCKELNKLLNSIVKTTKNQLRLNWQLKIDNAQWLKIFLRNKKNQPKLSTVHCKLLIK